MLFWTKLWTLEKVKHESELGAVKQVEKLNEKEIGVCYTD